MGNNYAVALTIKPDEDKAQEAIHGLRQFMENPKDYGFINGIDWSMDINSLSTIEDFILVMLADNNTKVRVRNEKDGSITYMNDFSCSYGWESVMMKMWEIIGSHLDGTYYCSVDEGEYEYEAEDGTITQTLDRDY